MTAMYITTTHSELIISMTVSYRGLVEHKVEPAAFDMPPVSAKYGDPSPLVVILPIPLVSQSRVRVPSPSGDALRCATTAQEVRTLSVSLKRIFTQPIFRSLKSVSGPCSDSD
jgi:hypothetical protein